MKRDDLEVTRVQEASRGAAEPKEDREIARLRQNLRLAEGRYRLTMASKPSVRAVQRSTAAVWAARRAVKLLEDERARQLAVYTRRIEEHYRHERARQARQDMPTAVCFVVTAAGKFEPVVMRTAEDLSALFARFPRLNG